MELLIFLNLAMLSSLLISVLPCFVASSYLLLLTEDVAEANRLRWRVEERTAGMRGAAAGGTRARAALPAVTEAEMDEELDTTDATLP